MLNLKKFFLLIIVLIFNTVQLTSYAQDADTEIKETIPSTLIDTYKISLEGNILNDVSALNIMVKIPGKDADISTALTLQSTGASILLSTVTGPDAEEYTISIVFNGKITDGKAVISGKFIENSIVKDAEFILTTITRDGGEDITSSLTREISFSNSKATPTPSATATPSSTPTATPEDTSSPTETPSPTATPLGVETKTEAVNDIVDLIVADNGELDIDPSEIIETIVGEGNAKLTINTSPYLQLKKSGLNKIFARVSGSIDRKFIKDTNSNQLSCFLFPTFSHVSNSDGDITLIPVDFIRFSDPILSVQIPATGSKFRFSKRVALNVVPDGDGLELLKGNKKYYDFILQNFCIIYDKNADFADLKQFAASKGQNVASLKANQLFEYFAYKDLSSYNLFYQDSYPNITLLAPEDVTDSFPPQLVSAETDLTGKKLILTFDEALVHLLTTSSNSFSVNGTAQETNVSAFKNKITITFSSGTEIEDGSTLDYSGNLQLKDSRGNLVNSFSNIEIVSKKDTILPELVSYKFTDGFIDLYYSEKLAIDPKSEFIDGTDFKIDDTISPYYVEVQNNRVSLHFSSTLRSSNRKLNYTPGVFKIYDLAGNAIAPIKGLQLNY